VTAEQARSFVRRHGIVLASAKGPAPRLAEAIAGGPIKGSWWAHAKGRQIFRILEALSGSPDILVCRLVGGRLTLVHRRLWAALARVADRLDPDRICQVRQEHTPAGHHVSREVPFPRWVPREVLEEARRLSDGDALEALGGLVGPAGPAAPARRRPRQ